MAKQDPSDTCARPGKSGGRRSVVSSLFFLRDEQHSASDHRPQKTNPSQARGSLLGRVMGAATSGGEGCGSAAPTDGRQQSSPTTEHRAADVDATVEDPAVMNDEAKSYGVYAYGSTFMESGEYSRALGCYNHALVLQRRSIGVDHEMTGRTLRAVGTCLMKMGGEHSFAALTALEEALYVRQLNFGEGDPGAAEITNDIWSLLHKKRLELSDTPDRAGMLKEMKKQKSRKELQSFVFQSVRRRGSMWSSDSIRNLQPSCAPLRPSSPSSASSSVRSEMTASSIDTESAVCENYGGRSRNDFAAGIPSSIPSESSNIAVPASSGQSTEILLNDLVKPTTAASARLRRRNSLIGATPAMKRIGEDSIGSLDNEEGVAGKLTSDEELDQKEEGRSSTNFDSGDDPYQGQEDAEPREGAQGMDAEPKAEVASPATRQFRTYSGVSFRDIGDLGGRWAREADETYDSLKCYDALREEAAQQRASTEKNDSSGGNTPVQSQAQLDEEMSRPWGGGLAA